MSWLQEVAPRRGWRDDRPVAQQFEEDIVLVPRDVESGWLLRERDPEDGQTWIAAYASEEALGSTDELVDTVQLRGHELRERISTDVGIRFRPTSRRFDEVAIRWPKITPVQMEDEA